MPEAAARNPDDDGLFTAPVLRWLHRCGCRGVHRLEDDAAEAGDAPLPAGTTPEWVTRPVGRHGTPVSGWRFGWFDDTGRARHLLLAFADAEQLPEAARSGLAAYLGFAGGCRDEPGGSAHLIDRDDASRRLHDLRNGLNSLLMNAAVMTTKLPPADRDGRFARQVHADGERCAALLQEFADALRPGGAARSG